MEKTKNTISEILSCEICEGSGVSAWWVSPDGDFDFEWCDCNHDHLIPDVDF